jgi:alpha-tubulin suppressor-like RCC1 family protein
VDPSGRTWCWGGNFSGELGDGTGTPSGLGCLLNPFQCRSPVPVLVRGNDLVFRQVSAGGGLGGPTGFGEFTCGVTTDNRAYCWGSNNLGQLGNDGTHDLTTPHPVAGDHHFRQVSTGELYACAVTPQNKAYCWGRNEFGNLGDGTDAFRQRHPVPVVGGLQFSSVSVGLVHTCAVTTSGAAYCWGAMGAASLASDRGSHRGRRYR